MPCRFESGPGHQIKKALHRALFFRLLFACKLLGAAMSVREYNRFQLLRQCRLQEATKAFSARGKSVVRCQECQLADFACICSWRPRLTSDCDFILLLHRDEVFKPTNTGRLVADVFPEQTFAFCWHRTQLDPALLALLADTQRFCILVFPTEAAVGARIQREVLTQLPPPGRKLTFILLDGTWKQSGRMFHLSQWLGSVPTIALPEALIKGYAVRKSHQDHYLATAEAASLCLELAGEQFAAQILQDYFQLFNQHYLATRGCYPPEIGVLHEKLRALTI